MPTPHADTALLVMDVQPGIIDRVADAQSFLKQTTAAIDAAHARGFPVIHVVVGFRPGAPEASPRLRIFRSPCWPTSAPMPTRKCTAC